MPKRTDIQSILIIGAGPIVIGQACEFDYSGTQACKALRQEGYRIILVNSNPATIMTDPELADATYVEPITPEVVERIIAREQPDALLPTMGGQTGLNVGLALHQNGVLDKYGCILIGADDTAIARAEDRQQFREAMHRINLEVPRSVLVHSIDEARAAVDTIGLPAIIRPSFTLGGIGGGIAYNVREFEEIVTGGLADSPTTQVLVEESVLGWKEYEMEVVRDKNDNCIIICSIENVDPMGIHTGDSITVAPALTLTDKEYQIMRDASIAVLREIGVETGGSNVQFAVNPANGRLVVIEMNPRVSRSSALASKATGFPIARVAALLAVGYTLDELQNDITGTTPASFEPTIDYIVTKIPRFTFEKFPGVKPTLTTSMKSIGEGMAMGRSFQESLQKGLRSMETGLDGLNNVIMEGVNANSPMDWDALQASLSAPDPERLLRIAQAFRLGADTDFIHQATRYDPWFLEQIKGIIDAETVLMRDGLPHNQQGWRTYKRMGFSDARMGTLTGHDEATVSSKRRAAGVRPTYKRVDTCAGEFPSQTSYLYSCYEGNDENTSECESQPSDKKKIMILGGGPNRIGQGIEFDCCCVHAAYALSDAGYETIMINCNPETVSTDYDTSDRLYFEPLTFEDVSELIHVEQQNGTLHGVIVQLGGQTPLKLASSLEAAGVPILGTSPDAIDLAEDRERFHALLEELSLAQPAGGIARSPKEAMQVAKEIGYPLVVRPSYVLGGRAMEIVHDDAGLERYISEAMRVSGDTPVLLDTYLQDAVEVDIDLLSDGRDVYIAGIMEHIEEAGIHSGDSACSLPPHTLEPAVIDALCVQSKQLALALGVRGLMNAQFAIKDGALFLLEANPRASRTVPFVAKATGRPIAKIAARVMAGETLASFELGERLPDLAHMAIKEAVFPFRRFPGVDSILGPEMKSTGEVIGLDASFGAAYAKSQLGVGMILPRTGTVLLSLKERDKTHALDIARRLQTLGFSLMCTEGSHAFFAKNNIQSQMVNKVQAGRPHCVDAILNGEVCLVINTTEGARSIADSASIRKSALTQNIAYYTTLSGAQAAVMAMEYLHTIPMLEVSPLQAYF